MTQTCVDKASLCLMSAGGHFLIETVKHFKQNECVAIQPTNANTKLRMPSPLVLTEVSLINCVAGGIYVHFCVVCHGTTCHLMGPTSVGGVAGADSDGSE